MKGSFIFSIFFPTNSSLLNDKSEIIINKFFWSLESKPNNKSHILIIEDIYDTGETLNELINYLDTEYNPVEIKTVVMLDKKIEKKSFVDIEWKGFDIEDTWVYGYGMDDENGTMRQVLYISDE